MGSVTARVYGDRRRPRLRIEQINPAIAAAGDDDIAALPADTTGVTPGVGIPLVTGCEAPDGVK